MTHSTQEHVRMLDHEDPLVRRDAVIAIGNSDHRRIPLLVRMLSDENEAVVAHALYGLGKAAKADAWRHVEEKLTDHRPVIRRAAVITLDSAKVTRLRRQAPILVPLLLHVMANDGKPNAPSGAATTAALNIFRKIGPTAATFLADHLQDKKKQTHALDALNVTGAKDLTHHLEPLVKNPSIMNFRRVISLLEKDGKSRAVRMLTRMAASDDGTVSKAAADALVRIKNPKNG